MNDSKLKNIVEVKRFLKESNFMEFKRKFRTNAYGLTEKTLKPLIFCQKGGHNVFFVS